MKQTCLLILICLSLVCNGQNAEHQENLIKGKYSKLHIVEHIYEDVVLYEVHSGRTNNKRTLQYSETFKTESEALKRFGDMSLKNTRVIAGNSRKWHVLKVSGIDFEYWILKYGKYRNSRKSMIKEYLYNDRLKALEHLNDIEDKV